MAGLAFLEKFGIRAPAQEHAASFGGRAVMKAEKELHVVPAETKCSLEIHRRLFTKRDPGRMARIEAAYMIFKDEAKLSPKEYERFNKLREKANGGR